MAYVVDGNVVRKKECEWDGESLIEKSKRRKYVVQSAPLLMTERGALGVGSRAVNAFFVSSETATTFDPPRGKSTITNGDKSYQVTPEMIFEMCDAADMKALNLSQGIPWFLVWMSFGAGGAAMVILYFLFGILQGFGA